MIRIGLYHDPYRYTAKDLEMRKINDSLIDISGTSHDYSVASKYISKIEPPYNISYEEERKGYFFTVVKEIPDIKEIMPQLSAIADEELRSNIEYLLTTYKRKYDAEVEYNKRDSKNYEDQMKSLWNENYESRQTLDRLISEMKKK